VFERVLFKGENNGRPERQDKRKKDIKKSSGQYFVI
jgi:hypothetical protein